ncbi:MAG: hypothetical protein NTW97_02655 [Candidatus Krumholzibacteria bacterium]|nr:hypothetical protein [Candidatus Krumholzibacteria bacterium]
MRYTVVLFVAFLLAPHSAAPAEPAGSAFEKGGAGSAGPGIASSVFRADGDLVSPGTERVGERLPLRGTRVALPGALLFGPSPAQRGSGAGASWSRRNTAVAILASAILPGMGELYCYRTSRDPWTMARVPVFLAAEGFLWSSYFDNKNTGKYFKRKYEAFADAHWSLAKFLQDHPWCKGIGGCASWEVYNNGAKNDYNYFFYTPREADREEYYENIGKYNAFVFGWDDCTRSVDDTLFTYWTGRRTEYVSIRNESDRYLLRADQRLMGLIVSRVVSMLDTGWLAYRISKGQDPDKGWSLRFRTVDETPIVVINRRF